MYAVELPILDLSPKLRKTPSLQLTVVGPFDADKNTITIIEAPAQFRNPIQMVLLVVHCQLDEFVAVEIISVLLARGSVVEFTYFRSLSIDAASTDTMFSIQRLRCECAEPGSYCNIHSLLLVAGSFHLELNVDEVLVLYVERVRLDIL